MKRIAIGIDNWKLPIFQRHLQEAGYSFEQFPFTGDTLILKVKAKFASDIQPIVEAAQKECHNAKNNAD